MDQNGPVHDLTLDNVTLDGSSPSNPHGFLGESLNGDLTITNSTLQNIQNWAVLDTESGGVVNFPLDSVVFSNNTIQNVNGAIAIRGDLASPTKSVVISDNVWNDIGDGSFWAAVEVNTAIDVDIIGNTIGNFKENDNEEGIQVWDISDLLIDDNTIDGAATGIWAPSVRETTVGTVSNNTITNSATVGILVHYDDGIWPASNGTRLIVANNSIKDGKLGITVKGAQSKALVERNDLNGNITAGLMIMDGAIVDAGQTESTATNFTGLGTSSGRNNFAGYSDTSRIAFVDGGAAISISSADPTAGPSTKPPTVSAQGNHFLNASAADIEAVIDHDADDSMVAFVDASEPAPFTVSNGVLTVWGSDGKDSIRVQSKRGTLELKLYNKQERMKELINEPVSLIVMYGYDGNDSLDVHKKLDVRAVLFGGDGKDKLRGGAGQNALIGGTDKDSLTGGQLDDLLIGGNDQDRLRGYGGDDILVGGTTAYDNDLDSILEILDGTLMVVATDVVDDLSNDNIDGGKDVDLFFTNLSGDRREADGVRGDGDGDTVIDVS